MSRAQYAVATLVMVLAVFAMGRSAGAADACPPSPRPVIVLTARVKPPDQVVADALRDHLRTQLSARGIDLCVGSAAPRTPIGRVLLVIDRPESGSVTALVRIGDAVTDKRVERTMNLKGMPPDARALAVSASADELIRASWAELMIVDAPRPKMEPPTEVLRAVVESLEVPKPHAPERAFQLGVLGSVTLFKNMLGVGPEVWSAFFFHEHVGTFLRPQLSFIPAKDSANGSVRASSLGGHAGLAVAFNSIVDPRGLGFEAGAGARRVSFTASANESAAEATTVDWSAEVAGGPRGWLQAGPVRFTLGAELVYPLRPTTARDAGEVVLSNEGIGGRVSLGVLMQWLTRDP